MSFFISSALAAGTSASTEGNLSSLFLLAMFMVAFYFMLIRPQSKRAKEHRNLLSQLAQGDEVVTTGGLYGKITQLNEETLKLEIANQVEVKLQKSAIAASLPKGTLKQL